MRIFRAVSRLRSLAGGSALLALMGGGLAAAQPEPVLRRAPVGRPIALVPAGERDGVVFLEAASDATTALAQPYCGTDAGINQCLVARCNSASCGFPALLDDSHAVSFDVQVTHADLTGFFGTTNCVAKDINVGLDVDHTYVSDIQAAVSTLDGDLFLPIGYLLENSPNCAGDNLELVFDDAAAASAPTCQAGVPAYRGTVRPHDNGDFAGISIPVGSSTDFLGDPTDYRNWAVNIEDVEAQDSGAVEDVWIAWGLDCSTGGGGCSIAVSPGQPTTASLPTFTVSGNWPNGCPPTFESGTIDTVNRIVRINAVANPGCLTCTSVVTPYTIAAQVQSALPAGSWQVQFHVRECSNPYTLRCSNNFQVTQPSTSSCLPGPTTLCIDDNPGDRRFKVEVSYATAQGGGFSGPGRAVALSSLGVTRGGLFWFFSADNPELLVKVLDGCPLNSRHWVYLTAGTNVGYVVTITDTVTGSVRQYSNGDGVPAQPTQDVNALVCD